MIIDKNALINKLLTLIITAPFLVKYLPNKEQVKKLNNGKKIINKYIINP